MNKRFVAALVGVTMITLVLAFAWVFNRFNASQEQQLDDALVAEAYEEALEIAQAGTDRLQISARPGPSANDVGPLTKYAAIYDVDGTVLDLTETFQAGAPALDTLPAELDVPFDLSGVGERLRAVRVAIPDRSGDTLLLAAPRTDLDGDARLLAGAMAIVYTVAVGLTILAISFLVNRFTRLHRKVAAVTRRVAQGDLGARVGVSRGTKESVRLARDLDETIARLETLVSSQQRFVASAAHEIRSPLTALYGELSNALRRERDAEEYRAIIERSVLLTRDLRDVAENLLELARLGARSPRESERIDLAAILERVVESIEGGPERVERKAIGRCWVEGRAIELHALVRNLVENALSHSPSGSRVVVHGGTVDGRVVLCVDDAGPGIDDVERELVFEPFHRGRAARATTVGAGLGLTIARTIARTHGGDITAERSPLGGARLRVVLPAFLEAEEARPRGV